MAGLGMEVRRLGAVAVLALASAGCAATSGTDAPGASRVVSAPEPAVRDRIREALKDAPELSEPDAHAFRTGWIQGDSPRSEMGFVMRRPLKQQRLYLVQTAATPEGGTTVRVRCSLMEKGNSGANALSWRPIASDGHFENELLDQVEKASPAPPPPAEKKP